MMYKIKVLIAMLLSVPAMAVAQKQPDLVRYANTLQGTDSNFGLSHGNTFPATAMPYGVHVWTPQTNVNGEGFKYLYSHDRIRGFGQSHQCSPWVSDYAVYTFMPETGRLVVNENDRASKFSHDNEVGRPHYYKVTFDNGITTEMAPTDRGVHLRFSYPKGQDAFLVIDGYTDTSEVRIDAKRRQIRGWVRNHRFVNHPENFRCYFVVQFDRAFADYGTWENQNNRTFSRQTYAKGKGAGVYLKFRPGSKVQAKAASSYISYAQAELNLERELGGDRSLEATKARGFKVWNNLFNRVRVEGGTDEDMRTFYSCLFRANLFSRRFYDLDNDGKPYYYSPYDGKIHHGYMYTDNGFGIPSARSSLLPTFCTPLSRDVTCRLCSTCSRRSWDGFPHGRAPERREACWATTPYRSLQTLLPRAYARCL